MNKNLWKTKGFFSGSKNTKRKEFGNHTANRPTQQSRISIFITSYNKAKYMYLLQVTTEKNICIYQKLQQNKI
jgi:hypothetical protein